jgi:NADPH:quinone reductase
MSAQIPAEALQLRSLVRADQMLELFLDMVPVPEPGPDEVLIRVEAAPLNPSDMGLLFAGADMAVAVASGSAERPVVVAPIPEAAMRGLAGRVGTPLPVGNEGAGTVVAAGGSAAAVVLYLLVSALAEAVQGALVVFEAGPPAPRLFDGLVAELHAAGG